MTKSTKYSTFNNILTVIVGGMLMGLLWRARGTHGWGSESGVFNVGLVFTLFLIVVKGARKKLNLFWIALTSASFMLTVPSWGTINSQITGILHETEVEGFEDVFVNISVPSAIFMMLCIGFGMAAIYGLMLGRGYSNKPWKIKDIAVMLAAFLVGDLVSKASISHLIVNFVQPGAVELFEQGLEQAGIDGSVYSVYMQHFADISWGKKIIGGRNYFSEIQAVSSAIRAFCSIAAVRFIVKDKTSAKIGLSVCSAFAISISVADIFFYFGNGGYHELSENLLPSFIPHWSTWEYFTGFISGIIITAVIISLKETEDVAETAFLFVPRKPAQIITFIIGYAALLGYNIVRPISERFDSTDTMYIVSVIFGIIFAAAIIILLCKKAGINAEKIGMQRFSSVMLVFFTAFISLLYFVVCAPEYFNITELTLPNILFAVSSVCVLVWSIINLKSVNRITGK